MYPLLLAAGIVLLALFGRREHLAFTETIKDVRTKIDPAEEDRIFQMAPTSLQQRAAAVNAKIAYPGNTAKTYVAGFIRQFQRILYIPATAPITEEVLNSFIAERRTDLQREPPGPWVTFFLDAYSNGEAKALLMAYLGLARTAGTIPPLSTVPTSSTSASVPQLLEQMRDNLLEYKMTGRSEYKAVYDGTKAWVDRYVSNLSQSLTREADTITTDVNAYRTADTELAKAQTDFQTIKADGPKLGDRYSTVKAQMDQGAVVETPTGTYVKVGIAGGLILGAAALSFF